MIKLLVAFLLSLLVGSAFAEAPVQRYGFAIGTNGALVYYEDWKAGCDAWFKSQTAASQAYQGGGVNYTKSQTWGMCVTLANDYTFAWTLGSICSDGVTKPDTSKPLASQCPDKCPAGVKNTVRMTYGANFTRPFVSSDIPSSYNGCKVDMIEFKRCKVTVSTNVLYCTFVVSNTGAAGSPAPGEGASSAEPVTTPAPGTEKGAQLGPVKAPNAVACPNGTVQAGMSSDGVPLCVGMGTAPDTSSSSSSTTKPETTVSNADGSSVKTQVTEIINSDGSVTTSTKTTTTAADGTVAVKVDATTGNTPTGQPGKPGANGTNGKDAQGICQTNPELTVCRNSTVSGDCTAGVSYTGDAIQGATLQAAKAIQCKQQKDDDELKASGAYSKGSAVMGGSDPDAASLPSPGKAESVAMPTSLDTSGFAGAGAVFSDVSFTVQGRSITVPLNKWSSYLLAFRYVLMVIASLVSFRMLSGAILRD